MGRIAKYLVFIFLGGCLTISACQNPPVYNVHTTLENKGWSYNFKPKYFVPIRDTSLYYNVFLNIRHTDKYKYSNLFVIFTLEDVNLQRTESKYEFKLAESDGRWLGTGSGFIYSYKLPILEKVKFDKPGIYLMQLEQNMRDEPLLHIEDIGIKVEISEQ